ncbi:MULTISPECIES: fumarylacetoacetate hydrolase family protein [Paenarthrobacter]|uniref:fumarylacetoacetate hydrolase family protein n=1 Tax=Paenarthrobacter TaxID=1742992 RepID=UPI0011A3D223|nr:MULTISPECIES: fumarylacetoacetate hydrolase family protein [Paenarthrobacter]MDP9937602.1 2-keto-4-pentenoate hydratase/2-oxohepta-3-ene-1,7-dioic acid hydratase in catechol pathway [Paenarthrobacter nicotinovorans]UXM91923.1 fumarylacetoacetate hydrolase family protein [Paenarthrobacter sp. JL.01a]
MKIVSYEHESGIRGGVLIEDTVYDLELLLQGSRQAVHGATTSVREFLELYGDRLEAISAEVSVLAGQDPEAHVGARADVRLATPVPNPSKVLCIGLNYKDHVAETGRAFPDYPDVFAKFASTMVGPEDEIGGAKVSENLDFEGELAVVIGRKASEVTEEEALNYVAALAPLNDVTARDLQYRGTQWLAGKAVDGSTPWGPALVTLDEVGDPQNLDLATRVNGIEVQRSNTSYQIFPIARIISYLSSFLTLEPGDVIATGTPQGIGAKRNPPVWLEPGDTVEIEIDKVGLLRNTVGKPQL